MVQLAQLVESWIVVPVVVGSSPTLHPESSGRLPELIFSAFGSNKKRLSGIYLVS